MKWLLPLMGAVSLSICAWELKPLLGGEESSPRLEISGVRQIKHRDFDRIDAVLARRAPGWGIQLRAHVSNAVAEEAERAGFDPLLVLAIITVESEFHQQAVSVVGAKGLMQVRPTTLDYVAEKEGIKLSRKEIDADPSLNVRLGVRYLRSLQDMFRGNLDLALMAYNAGPTRLYLSLRERSTDQFANYVRAVRREFTALKVEHGEPNDWAFASREP